MSLSGNNFFILQYGYRRVIAYHDQCPDYSVSHLGLPLTVGLSASLTASLPQNVLTLARSTFASLRQTDDKDIIFLGRGEFCPWDGYVELSERAWGDFHDKITGVEISLRQRMYPLDSEGKLLTSVIDRNTRKREIREQRLLVLTRPGSKYWCHRMYRCSRKRTRVNWPFVTMKEGIPLCGWGINEC
jgi:hypothetical protein